MGESIDGNAHPETQDDAPQVGPPQIGKATDDEAPHEEVCKAKDEEEEDGQAQDQAQGQEEGEAEEALG